MRVSAHPLRFASVLALSLTIAACGGADHPRIEGPFTFTFAPGDGTIITQGLNVSRSQTTALGMQRTVTDTKTRFTISKTSDGYRVASEEVYAETTRNGELIEDPVSDLLRRMQASYLLDTEGRLQSITGFEEVTERITLELPPELGAALAPILTPAVLENAGKEEWAGRYGNFVGKTAEVGDVWVGSREVPMPGVGKVVEFNATWVSEKAECGDRECVRLVIFQDTDVDALKDKLLDQIGPHTEGLLDEVEAKAGESDVPDGYASKTVRLVDPFTLLAYEETQNRVTSRFVQGGSEQSQLVTIGENRTYEFEYSGS